MGLFGGAPDVERLSGNRDIKGLAKATPSKL